MSEVIDHHPIRFDYTNECNLSDHNWMQFAEYGDVQQFQLEIGPCAYEQNAIVDGSFSGGSADWVSSGFGWSIDTTNGLAVKTQGASGVIRQDVETADGVYWMISMDVVIGSGQFAVNFGADTEIVSATGSYTFYFMSDTVVSLKVSADGTTSGSFTNVVALPINTNFEVYVVDANGTTQHTYDGSDFNFTNQWATLSVDWEDIAVGTGCYTLQVSDPCHCVQGGFIQEDFETDTEAWSTDSTWTISGGTATFSGASATGQALMSGILCAGTSYDVRYTLANMAGNTFYVQLGSATGATQNANGTYSETIVCTNSSSLKLVAGGFMSSLSVHTFSITATTRTVQHTSVPIRVLESAADCTHKITVCNDSDGMGAGFEFTGFSPMLRMGCQYAHGGATSTRNSYEFSTGKKSTTYYRGRKNKSLTFMAPSYIHDFMIHLGGYDHVYIDGTEVFIEDDEYPTISWNKETDLGGVTLTVREKDVLIENRRKSSKEEACDPNGNPITTGNNEIIFLPDGGKITTG